MCSTPFSEWLLSRYFRSDAYFIVVVGTDLIGWSFPLPFPFTRTVDAPSVVVEVSVLAWASNADFCAPCASRALSIILANIPFLSGAPPAGNAGGGGGVHAALRGNQPRPGTLGSAPKPVMKYCCTAPKILDTAQ